MDAQINRIASLHKFFNNHNRANPYLLAFGAYLTTEHIKILYSPFLLFGGRFFCGMLLRCSRLYEIVYPVQSSLVNQPSDREAS